MKYYDIYDDDDDILATNVPESEIAARMKAEDGSYFELTRANAEADRAAFAAQTKKEATAAEQRARYDALSEPYRLIAPYSAREYAETGKSDLLSMATLKDAFSLLGRLGSTAGESDWQSMGKISEEHDGIIGSTLASPVTGAALLAAPFAPLAGGALSLSPFMTSLVTGVTEGAVATAAGAAFDDKYGGTDAAFDVLLSTVVPVLGPVIKNMSRSQGRARIVQLLKEKGIHASEWVTDALYAALAKSDGSAVFKPSLGTVADRGKEVKKIALGDLSKDIIPGELPTPSRVLFPSYSETTEAAAKAAAKAAEMERLVIENVKSSLVRKKHPRTLSEIDETIGRVKSYFHKQAYLDEQMAAGGMFEHEFSQPFAELLSEYADIPELVNQIQGTYSKSLHEARTRAMGNMRLSQVAKDGSLINPPNATPQKQGTISGFSGNWDNLLGNLQAGDLAATGKLLPSPDFSWQNPITSTTRKLKTTAGNYMYPLAGLASEGVRFLPQLTRELYSEPGSEYEEENNNQPPVTLPVTQGKTQYGIGRK
jgi:hypothetical protein